jgi:hypothetical protein
VSAVDTEAAAVWERLTPAERHALELCDTRRGSKLATFDTDCIALRRHALLVDASMSLTDIGRRVAAHGRQQAGGQATDGGRRKAVVPK